MTLSKNKWLHRIYIFVVLLVAIVLIYKLLISGHALPKLGKGSISTYMTLDINGTKQSLLIRGDDTSNPVLLYLHGGPGNPETSFIVPSQSAWEKEFVVVNWDQTGSGRSYDSKLSASMLTTDRICSDALAITHWLKAYFHTDKIYLVGHSYGTLVGMRCIAESPEDFYGYVGTGQVADQQQNEQLILDYARSMAQSEGNEVALNALAPLGNLPYDQDQFGKQISLSRKWSTYYGGSIYDEKDVNRLNLLAILRPEYSLIDLIHFLKGNDLYYTNTADDLARWELFNANLFTEIPSVNVPVCFIQGENDYIVCTAPAQAYYEALEAPYKDFHLIEKAAHNAPYEQPEIFSQLLIDFKNKTYN